MSGFSTGATTYGMPICSFPISIDGQASAFTGNLRGTVGYVPKYGLTATGIVISQIYDTGTGVGIGTTTPIARLDVNGSMSLT